MTMAASSNWFHLPCRIAELRLDITLACGQSFRWKEIHEGMWRSVLAGKIWTLKQTEEEILFQVQDPCNIKIKAETVTAKTDISRNAKICKGKQKSIKIKSETVAQVDLLSNRKGKHSASSTKSVEVKTEACDESAQTLCDDSKYTAILKDYFQLDVDLGKLYEQWRRADANFNQVAADFPGVRILRQDPAENLFAFICSSNNNISRITSMVEKLCTHYGDKIGCVDGVDWYGFPPVAALAREGVEQHLRELGFGYRAKFINQSAKFIAQKEDGWLNNLRFASYEEAHSELLQLIGVGAKVADCVCLMSMDKTGAIPVDTHVWQIAARDYMPKLTKAKSLTDRIYKEIGDHFRALFGDYAGWAHSVLFSADLKKFKGENSPSKSKVKMAIKRKSSAAGDAPVTTKQKKKSSSRGKAKK